MTSAATSATNDAYTVIVATKAGDHGPEFLMVRHRQRGWELPGGRLEDNEGPVHCALREFREETGHLLSEPKFVLKLEKENGTCYVFRGGLGARVENRNPNEAIEAMRWCTTLPEELAFPDDPYEEIGQAMGMRFR